MKRDDDFRPGRIGAIRNKFLDIGLEIRGVLDCYQRLIKGKGKRREGVGEDRVVEKLRARFEIQEGD